MLLKDASRTKYERMSLAITVLEMPTMSIAKSLEPLWAINWNDARPWIVMLGAVILFLAGSFERNDERSRNSISKLRNCVAAIVGSSSYYPRNEFAN